MGWVFGVGQVEERSVDNLDPCTLFPPTQRTWSLVLHTYSVYTHQLQISSKEKVLQYRVSDDSSRCFGKIYQEEYPFLWQAFEIYLGNILQFITLLNHGLGVGSWALIVVSSHWMETNPNFGQRDRVRVSE